MLVRAPLSEGFVIPDAHLAFYGTGDLFETLPPAARASASAQDGELLSAIFRS